MVFDSGSSRQPNHFADEGMKKAFLDLLENADVTGCKSGIALVSSQALSQVREILAKVPQSDHTPLPRVLRRRSGGALFYGYLASPVLSFSGTLMSDSTIHHLNHCLRCPVVGEDGQHSALSVAQVPLQHRHRSEDDPAQHASSRGPSRTDQVA